jgi:LysR family transcriptional regulator, low CO2-responsive transcriptional regulator
MIKCCGAQDRTGRAVTTDARLRAFVTVAEAGSVRAAAIRLVVTESAVSAAIAALAREVGVPLLERDGRGLRLTRAGQTYAGYARSILGLHDEALAAARGGTDPEHGRVRVAAVTTAGEHVLPALLAAFVARYPGVDLGLEVATSERVWDLLATHRADLAIAGRPPPGLRDAVVRAVRPNTLVVVAAPAVAAGFEPGRTRWLLREAGSGTRATGEALLAGWEVDPPRLTLGSNGAVVAAAAAGLGVTLVSRDAVTRRFADGTLVQVKAPGTPLRRPWHAVTTGQAQPSTTLLIDHLLQAGKGGAWRAPPHAAASYSSVVGTGR